MSLMGSSSGGTPGRIGEVSPNLELVGEHLPDTAQDTFNPHGLWALPGWVNNNCNAVFTNCMLTLHYRSHESSSWKPRQSHTTHSLTAASLCHYVTCGSAVWTAFCRWTMLTFPPCSSPTCTPPTPSTAPQCACGSCPPASSSRWGAGSCQGVTPSRFVGACVWLARHNVANMAASTVKQVIGQCPAAHQHWNLEPGLGGTCLSHMQHMQHALHM